MSPVDKGGRYRADNLATFKCRLSENFGSHNFLDPYEFIQCNFTKPDGNEEIIMSIISGTTRMENREHQIQYRCHFPKLVKK